MIALTLAEIAAITGGRVRGSGTPGDAGLATSVVTGPVVIDSRRVTPGALFAALPGVTRRESITTGPVTTAPGTASPPGATEPPVIAAISASVSGIMARLRRRTGAPARRP